MDPELQDAAMQTLMVHMGLQSAGMLTGLGSPGGQLHGLRLQTLENDGKRARVRLISKVRVEALGTYITLPLDVDVPVVRRAGRWYVTMPR
jgi:hypothetical protein